jgi:hypothetical protein
MQFSALKDIKLSWAFLGGQVDVCFMVCTVQRASLATHLLHVEPSTSSNFRFPPPPGATTDDGELHKMPWTLPSGQRPLSFVVYLEIIGG